MRRITILFAAILMALTMALPAVAHPNTASGKGIGVVEGKGLVGQGHYLGIDCNAAEAGNTPFSALGLCEK